MTSLLLFAETESAGLVAYLRENWLLLMPALLGFTAIYLLLPKAHRITPIVGAVLGIGALVLGARILDRANIHEIESILFFSFSALAIGAGVMMITQQNPVHAALSFALVILSTCGLFLLLAAPFLMAATIIVYAGAIVVTFLFVIMLAQQEGASTADQHSREPFLASLAGCILLAALTCILHKSHDTRELDQFVAQLKAVAQAEDEAEVKRIMGDPAKADKTKIDAELTAALIKRFDKRDTKIKEGAVLLNQQWGRLNVPAMKNFTKLKEEAAKTLAAVEARRHNQASLALDNVPGKKDSPSRPYGPGKLPAQNVAGLGKTMFTDYLVPVELAAVLLLVATIGAIVIAGRRAEGLR